MNGQKVVKKSLINGHVSLIQIDTNNCFDVTITTAETNELVVEACNGWWVQRRFGTEHEGGGASVLVSAGFQPNFANPNDKLSAHKVVSIALKITIPEQISVHVYGTSGDVTASDLYTNLNIVLNDGNCTLNQVSETVEVTTQRGRLI